MEVLNSKSIESLVSYIRENISVYAGEEDNERILIKPGLKLKHVGDKDVEGSGLNYTVDYVDAYNDGLLIRCTRHQDDGKNITITITSNDLKQFERA
tara:strand:- start:1318 stop:1608 length:291 start_codon:yes stop_codon:yes gene_type:complete